MAAFRQPAAPPPVIWTSFTVPAWMSMLVPKAKMKRMEPICTRSL